MCTRVKGPHSSLLISGSTWDADGAQEQTVGTVGSESSNLIRQVELGVGKEPHLLASPAGFYTEVCPGAKSVKTSNLFHMGVYGVEEMCVVRGGCLESSSSPAGTDSGWREGQGFSLMTFISLSTTIALHVCVSQP